MRTAYEERIAQASETERNLVRGSATLCGRRKFGVVCKALWPLKTAEHLAASAGCCVRAAEYQINGRTPSAKSLQAIINEVMSDVD